jgi:uncharacterized protein YciI
VTEPALAAHVICLLRAAPNRPELAEDELDAIQERHVAYQQQLRADGKIAAAGPFSDQPDASWRGLTLYTTSLEEARTLSGADPAVQAGRLVVDVFVWWTPNEVHLPGR